MALMRIISVARRSLPLFSSSPYGVRFIKHACPFDETDSDVEIVQVDTNDHFLPSPPQPDVMYYDVLAEQVKAKLRTLENPDARFLRHSCPIPELVDHSHILSVPETRITTLENGLRIATESTLASRTATVGVWIDAGSRFESDETNGMAYFLQRLIFKGTDRRSYHDLEEEIENLGGRLNAHTSRELTSYHAQVLGKDVPVALDILADVLQNPDFDEDEINRVRHEILCEIDQVQEQSEEVIFDLLHATAFQYMPLGKTVKGTADNIKLITKKQLQNYITEHYTAPRMVIAASGAVKHEEIVSHVEKLFTKISVDPTTSSQLVANEPTGFTGSEIRMIDDSMKIIRFAIAFAGVSWNDPDCITLMVMQAMLGCWDKTSTMGKHSGSTLVERMGANDVAESLKAFNITYKDTGLFGVYFVASKPDRFDDVSWAIMRELSLFCYRVIPDDVIRACNQLKASYLRQLDGTALIADDIGRQILAHGRRVPIAELFARIDAVDTRAVKRVANRIIFDKEIAISAIGCIRAVPDYNWFLRKCYRHRF